MTRDPASLALSPRTEPPPGRRSLRRFAAASAGTRLGRQWLGYLALEQPATLARALGAALSRAARLERVAAWPERLDGFEDVAPMVLSSNQANRGLASMALVEVAHLWRLAGAAGPATIVEIGRERGGSTLVLAAAMDTGATLWSYDPQTKLGALGDGHDSDLRRALDRYGLSERVRILRESSHTAELPPGPYALVLVDGDPSLAGTRLDFERFGTRLAAGGSVLFHDAAAGGPREGDLAPLVLELERDETLERAPDVGTFVQFVRRA
jgi:predicted O-methyltransferase YrrM